MRTTSAGFGVLVLPVSAHSTNDWLVVRRLDVDSLTQK
jgi:hypothetical protein